MSLSPNETPTANLGNRLSAGPTNLADDSSRGGLPLEKAPEANINPQSIDLRYLFEIIQRRWKLLAIIMLVTLVFGTAITSMQQRKYSSTSEILIPEQIDRKQSGDALETVNKIESTVTTRSADVYASFLRTSELFRKAMASLPEETRESLQGGMNVEVKQGKENKSNYITITVTALSPNGAAEMANSLVKALNDRDLADNSKASDASLAYVTAELKRIGKELHSSRKKLSEFQVTHGVAGDEELISQKVKQLAQLRLEADETARNATVAKNSQKTFLARLKGENRDILTNVIEEQNPILDQIDSHLNDLEMRRLELRQVYVPDSPEIKRIDGEIVAAKKHRASYLSTRVSERTKTINPIFQALEQKYVTASTDADTALIRLVVLKHEIAEKDSELSKLPSLGMQADELKNSVQLHEDTYAQLSRSYQDLRANKAALISNILVLNKAYPNPVPVSPLIIRSFLLSFIFGLMLVVLLTVALETFDNRLYTPRAVERHVTLPVLAQLPLAPRGKSPLLHLAQGDQEMMLEQMRLLRAYLMAVSNSSNQVIAITSPCDDEGKSTLAINLARVMAMNGKHVALVDADLRHPTLHTYLERSNKAGLTDLVDTPSLLETALITTGIDGVKLLPAGSATHQPPEILSSPEVHKLIRDLSDQFDVVIIDAGSTASVSDALGLTPIVDGFLMLISMGSTTRERLSAAQRTLASNQTPIIGYVCNRV